METSDLRRRILFTLWAFLVFRIGVHVPVPGINPATMERLFEANSLFGLLDLFSGGAFRAFGVFAMSITPYINASIIMQLLTIVVPQFEEWAKEGQEGRKKLTQMTRYGTVILALVQAAGLSFFIRSQGALIDSSFASIAVIIVVLTAGTTILMWLGELMTEHGIGNGISLLIFAGIVARLPSGTLNLFEFVRVGRVQWYNLIVLAVLGLAILVGVVWIQQGQRRIPVHYAKRVVGRKVYGGQSSHIPIRVNQAGVIPVIFAASVLAFPGTIAQFINHPWAQAVANYLTFQNVPYALIYGILIIFFTFFYTAVTFNPEDVADNIRKHGGFIPGLRPGRTTTQYLAKVLERITLAGAVFLAAVAIMPVFFSSLVNIPNLYFGGTALLIVVGVSIETMKQIEAHLLMRNYEGFMK